MKNKASFITERMAESKHSGSCMCGGVTFELTGDPMSCGNCFCPDCQLNAGGPHNTVCVSQLLYNINLANFNQVGRWHVDNVKAASGNPKEKWFCSKCGTTLWTCPGAMNGQIKVFRLSLIENGSASYFELFLRTLLTKMQAEQVHAKV